LISQLRILFKMIKEKLIWNWTLVRISIIQNDQSVSAGEKRWTALPLHPSVVELLPLFLWKYWSILTHFNIWGVREGWSQCWL
jgi:hypothetical protein